MTLFYQSRPTLEIAVQHPKRFMSLRLSGTVRNADRKNVPEADVVRLALQCLFALVTVK
jgi:hypothetical protein